MYNESGHLYKTFITECCKGLESKKEVIVFYDYQVKELEEIYEKNLVVRYDKQNEWWKCKLKNFDKREKRGVNKRPDITYDKIKKLMDLGYNVHQISIKLKCTEETISSRIRGHEE